MRFGIICAMPEEIKELTAKLSDKQEKKIGGKSYLFGKINNQDVVLVESGIGKVEAGIMGQVTWLAGTSRVERPRTSTVRWLSLNDFRPLRRHSPRARRPTAMIIEEKTRR